MNFNDKLEYDPGTRTVISVRDGIQIYLGSEIGQEPADKVFHIYRAPETIRQFNDAMVGLPITDDHVAMDGPPTDRVGEILDSVILDALDPETNTTLKVQNKIKLDKTLKNSELSLGYSAELIPCEIYDFEQVEIIPHHLAIVERGRCGQMCSFTDGVETMKKKYVNFLDAATGEINMQQVMQLVTDLPEIVKTLPLKELQKLVPALTKAMELAAGEIATEAGMEVEEAPAAEELPVVETEDEADPEAEKKEMADSIKFADAVKAATRNFATVMAKAKDFLPETYKFADKTACQIMADAVATQHSDKFTDAELSTAFKLLKKVTNYQSFGDNQAKGLLETIGDKEI
jgi:hypothetical protein